MPIPLVSNVSQLLGISEYTTGSFTL